MTTIHFAPFTPEICEKMDAAQKTMDQVFGSSTSARKHINKNASSDKKIRDFVINAIALCALIGLGFVTGIFPGVPRQLAAYTVFVLAGSISFAFWRQWL